MKSEFAQKILEILSKCEAPLYALNPTDFALKPQPNKWSKKEILGHLIDSGFNNYQRFIRAQKNDKLIFKGYDQNAWVTRNDYQNRDEKEIISLFISTNKHIANLVSNLNEAELERTTREHNFDKIGMRPLEKGVTSSLGYLIEDYIFHLEHHLRQIL